MNSSNRAGRKQAPYPIKTLLLMAALANCLAADDAGSIARHHYEDLIRRGVVTGAAFAAIDHGRITSTEFFGKMRPDSLWRAASTSKALTALAILQLAARGQIDLDTDINAYLTTFKVPAFGGKPITARELLNHTSGLDDPFVGSAYLDSAGRQPGLAEAMRRWLPRSVYLPGQVRLYSNFGYGILGALIEDVAHVSYEEYMRAQVLQPLGMRESTFEQPLPAELRKRVVPSLERNVFGRIRPAELLYHRATPGGGLTASFQDLVRFAQCIQTSVPAGGVPVSRVEDYLGVGVKWGQRYWYAGGDLGGYHTVLLGFPDRDRALVTVAAGASEMATWGLAPDIVHSWFGDEKAARQADEHNTSNPHAVERCREVAGIYRPVRYPHFDIAKTFAITMDEAVRCDPDGSIQYDNQRWTPDAPLHFRQGGGTEELAFERNSAGRVEFMDKSAQRIAWYLSGRAAIVLYFGFIALGVCALFIQRKSGNLRALRVTAGLILAHSVGWLAAALAADPQHLIIGSPRYLACALAIGTLVPLVWIYLVAVTVRAIFTKRWPASALAISAAGALAFAFYIPFEFYWRIMLWPFASTGY
ncbi:MAG: serine hydrolase [Acidobacteriaceae bacterium]|nr:serine hydrolase [Acidobacteriaceae bacterium]